MKNEVPEEMRVLFYRESEIGLECRFHEEVEELIAEECREQHTTIHDFMRGLSRPENSESILVLVAQTHQTLNRLVSIREQLVHHKTIQNLYLG